MDRIIKLVPENFPKCENIWSFTGNEPDAEKFLSELREGARETWALEEDGEYIAEVSLVADNGDRDYTIPGRRIYLSRLIVKDGRRGEGIGRRMTRFACCAARERGYAEITVGVGRDNAAALALYRSEGFAAVLYEGRDEYGEYFKLLKQLTDNGDDTRESDTK